MRSDKAALEHAAAPHRRPRHRGHPGRARHGAGDGHLRPRRGARCRAVHRVRRARGGAARSARAEGLSRRRRQHARPRATPWAARATPCSPRSKLSAGYGAAPVLEDIAFEVRPGEMVALLGANGAGKSTTMRAVTGLLRPVQGAIVLDDRPIAAARGASHRRAPALALVPEGRQVFPELTRARQPHARRAHAPGRRPRGRDCGAAARASRACANG